MVFVLKPFGINKPWLYVAKGELPRAPRWVFPTWVFAMSSVIYVVDEWALVLKCTERAHNSEDIKTVCFPPDPGSDHGR